MPPPPPQPPLDVAAQTQAHRLLSSGSADEFRQHLKEKHVDLDLPNNQGCTLLITACAFDRCTLLPELVARTTNLAAATYANANNVLHFAALSTHPDVMRLLLEADVNRWTHLINVGNANGDTPLMVACTTKCVEGVEALLLHGADVAMANQAQVTALMCAAKVDDHTSTAAVRVIERLLAAPGISSSVNATNTDGNTALHFSVQSCCPDVTRALLTDPSVDCSIRNRHGLTALELANAIQQQGGLDTATSASMSQVIQWLQVAWTQLEAAAYKRSQELLLSYEDEESFSRQPAKAAANATTKPTKKKKKKPLQEDHGIPGSVVVDAPLQESCNVQRADVSHEEHATESDRGAIERVQDDATATATTPLDADDCQDEAAASVNLDQFYDTFGLFRTMEISLAHFALQDLDGLSMSQLEMLQDAHMHAFTVLNDKKVQVARQLEADRIHAAYELEQHILSLP